MANRISVEVNDKGEVTYDFHIDSAMDMLVALMDSMNHSSDLAHVIEGACDSRKTIRDAQEKAIAESDEDQIDMFNNEVKKLK